MSFLKNKKIILSILVFIGIILIKQNTFANTANVSISPSNPKVGDTVTITVTVSDVNTSTVTATVTGVVNGTIKVVGGDMEGKLGTFSKSQTFTAQSEGSINVSVSGNCVINGIKEDTSGSGSAKVSPKETTTTPPPTTPPSTPPDNDPEEPPADSNPSVDQGTTTKSSNNELSSLKVSEGTLSPKFSARTKSYTVEVGEDVESIKITATKSHNKATVSGTGTKKLNPGPNVFEIQVTAENGAVEIYKVTVNKPQPKEEEKKELELKLKSLVVKGVNEQRELVELTYKPDFSQDVYIYEMKVENSIESLMIEALAKEEGTVVEISGNENLVVGENVITIMLKTADGEKSATYQIIAIKEAIEVAQAVVAEPEEIPEDIAKSDKWIIIGGVSAGVVLIIIGCTIVVILHKRQDKIEQAFEMEEIETVVTPRKEKKNKKQEKDKEEDEIKEPKKGGRGRHF